MRSIVFEGNTWNVYENLREKDKQLHKNLCRILKEMQRENPDKGYGKPEQLKYEMSGFWCRRLSQYDRLIYKFD
ncbi:MAG: Txe/YoeB family addiction module toxin, partial [Bacteroidetes bacterium]|nr:Txe/YoeB family addiction module toxin [Bacteroidota bacterium]